MNILFIHRDLPPDTYTGVALQVHRLAGALTARGHQITIAGYSKGPEEALYRTLTLTLTQGRRHLLGSAKGHLFKRFLIPLALRRVPVDGYDIVHVHGDGVFLRYRRNFVRTFYGTAAMEMRHAASLKGRLAQCLSYLFEKREALCCRTNGCAVGISSHIARYLPGVKEVIPCMLGYPPPTERPEKTPFPSILFMGSAFSRKRGEWAMDLFTELAKSFKNLEMYYVGSAAHRDRGVFHSRYGKAFGNRIHFLQKIPPVELDALYKRAWLYLSLSTYEGFGVSLIEAMAVHTLVVATRTPGSQEILTGNKTGIFIDRQNALETIGEILSNADKRLGITRTASIESARFAPAEIARLYEGLYNRFLEKNHP